MGKISGSFVVLAVLCAVLPFHGATQASAASPTRSAGQSQPQPSPAEAAILAEDDTAHLDDNGDLYYAEPAPQLSAREQAAGAATPEALAPLADTFSLHSFPESARTIFLDFDGYDIPAGSYWTTSTQSPMTAGAVDGFWLVDDPDPTFNDAEKAHIQNVWEMVSEKYSAYDIDVTTEDPGAAAITRADPSDATYGVQVVFTNDPDPRSQGCTGCAGLASSNGFDDVGNNGQEVAWAFTSATSGLSVADAQVTAHEVGHTVGLAHDGLTTTPGDNYYSGHNNWIPIMGPAFTGRAIGQFSKGEYANANNTQDDLAVILANGLPTRTDDIGGTTATAINLGAQASYSTSGVIGTDNDQDVFKISRGCVNDLVATATTIGAGASLDIGLSILNGSGSQVAADDPPSGQMYDNTLRAQVPTGVDAEATASGAAAGTYFVKVDGVGSGDTPTDGYSDYASMGQYDLTITGCPVAPGTAPTTPATMSATPVSRSSTATLSWTAPAGSGSGPVTGYQITGVPGGAFESTGAALSKSLSGFTPGRSYTVGVAARNAFGLSARRTTTLRINTFAPLVAPTVTVTLPGNSTKVAWSNPSTAPGQSYLEGWTVEIYQGATLKHSLSLPWPFVDFLFPTLPNGTYEARVTGDYIADDVAGTLTGRKAFTVGPPATVFRKPSAPRIGTASTGALGRPITATARWLAPISNGNTAITKYRVYGYKLGSRNQVIRTFTSTLRPSSARSFVWALPSGRYKFRVIAYNRIGASPHSAYSRIVTSR